MKKVLLFIFVFFVAFASYGQTRKVLKKKTFRPESVEQRVLGRHMLSLQWISWEYFGYCDIKKHSDGIITCKGEHRSKENADYLLIDGTIEIVDAYYLKFTGSIVMSVHHINDGMECVRSGSFDFRSLSGRRYWRLQQMTNPCDGCTDYVDIYFK